MVISLSAAVLFGVVVLFLVRGGAMRASGAFAAMLFGFFLASTGIAPTINDLIASTVGMLSSL